MDETFLRSLLDPQYTKDLFLLEQAPKHLVFDCGPVMCGIDHYSTAFTVEKMSLYMKREANRPITSVPIRFSESPRARLRGTLYVMTQEQVEKLDKQRQNGIWFQREEVPIVLPIINKLQEPTRLVRPVWMYRGIPEYWEDRITWDMSFRRQGEPEYSMAGRFSSNIRYFHNHYGYDGLPAECLDLPASLHHRCPPAMIEEIGRKNYREIHRHKGLIKRMMSYI